MAITRLKKLLGLTGDLSRIQDATDQAFQELQQNLLPLGGVVLTGVTVNTTPTQVVHGLGRPAQGFIVASIDTGTVVYQPTVTNPSPNTIIILQAGTGCNTNLWVF